MLAGSYVANYMARSVHHMKVASLKALTGDKSDPDKAQELFDAYLAELQAARDGDAFFGNYVGVHAAHSNFETGMFFVYFDSGFRYQPGSNAPVILFRLKVLPRAAFIDAFNDCRAGIIRVFVNDYVQQKIEDSKSNGILALAERCMLWMLRNMPGVI